MAIVFKLQILENSVAGLGQRVSHRDDAVEPAILFGCHFIVGRGVQIVFRGLTLGSLRPTP